MNLMTATINQPKVEDFIVSRGTHKTYYGFDVEDEETRQGLRELVSWGRYMRHNNYFDVYFGNDSSQEYSFLKCNLAKLIDYGVGLRKGLTQHSHYDPKLLHTLRIWAFMYTDCQMALLFHFGWECSQKQKASHLGMTEKQFRYYRDKGIEIYLAYRDCDTKYYDEKLKKLN